MWEAIRVQEEQQRALTEQIHRLEARLESDKDVVRGLVAEKELELQRYRMVVEAESKVCHLVIEKQSGIIGNNTTYISQLEALILEPHLCAEFIDQLKEYKKRYRRIPGSFKGIVFKVFNDRAKIIEKRNAKSVNELERMQKRIASLE